VEQGGHESSILEPLRLTFANLAARLGGLVLSDSWALGHITAAIPLAAAGLSTSAADPNACHPRTGYGSPR